MGTSLSLIPTGKHPRLAPRFHMIWNIENSSTIEIRCVAANLSSYLVDDMKIPLMTSGITSRAGWKTVKMTPGWPSQLESVQIPGVPC